MSFNCVILILFLTCRIFTDAYAVDLTTEQVAEKICNSPKIWSAKEGRATYAQMLELPKYFDNIPYSNHSLSECREKYIESFLALEKALYTGKEGLCSIAKIEALEDFNRKFLSSAMQDERERWVNDYKAHKLVKVFFMEYANFVSGQCKRSFYEYFRENDLQIVDNAGQPVDTSDLDAIVALFSKSFHINIEKHGYSDLVLPWKLIDGLPTSSMSNKYLRKPEIDEKHPVPVRVSVQVKDSTDFRGLQQACKNYFKPVYSQLILPLIRLINMGLYRDYESLETLVSEHESITRIFGVTQLCETILPVELFDEPSLDARQVYILTVEHANKLRAAQIGSRESQVGEVEGQTETDGSQLSANSIANSGLKGMMSEDVYDDKSLIRDIVANRKKQERIIGRLTHITISSVKSQISRFIRGTNKEDGATVEIALENDVEEGERKEERSSFAVKAKNSLKYVAAKLKHALIDTGKVLMAFFFAMALAMAGVIYGVSYIIYEAFSAIGQKLKHFFPSKELKKSE